MSRIGNPRKGFNVIAYNAQARERKLRAVYCGMHRDYRGLIGGERHILVLREGATRCVPLKSLTDHEIETLLPKRKESH